MLISNEKKYRHQDRDERSFHRKKGGLFGDVQFFVLLISVGKIEISPFAQLSLNVHYYSFGYFFA